MNELIVLNAEGRPVTTSLAVAEGTGNDHASVIKLVRTHLADFEDFGLVRFEIRPRLQGQHGGSDTEFAALNEHQATLLITFMRNSEIVKAFKKKLVKSFFEYAQKARQPIDPMQALSDPDTLRSLLLGYADQNKALKAENDDLKPKAVALELISASADTLTFTQAAKVLGKKRDPMTTRMNAEGWVYRQNGSWVAYDKHIKSGNLVYKEASYTDEKTGLTCRKPYCHITQKGLVKLAQMFAVELELELEGELV